MRWLVRRKRTFTFRDLASGFVQEISWNYTASRPHATPFVIAQCEMQGLGCVSRGRGTAFNPRLAFQKAHAEAWERLWFLRIANSPPDLRTGAQAPTSTNGFAAGPNRDVAISEARRELFERETLLLAWHQRRGWNLTTSRDLGAKVVALFLKQNGWSFDLFFVPVSNLDGSPGMLAGLAKHPRYGAIFDSTFVFDDLERARGERKLALSLASILPGLENRPTGPGATLRESGSPAEHMRFYLDSTKLSAFDFLYSPSPHNFFDHVDLPTPGATSIDVLFEQNGMPCVARATNQEFRRLQWGRESISGTNPYPHPLA